MKQFENTFVRGPSPSYSDDAVVSENTLTATLPIGGAAAEQQRQPFLDGKLNGDYDGITYPTGELKHGRNTFAFWVVVTVLLVMCVGNLILTITIMGVLKLGKGMHGMELIPEEDAIKFFGSTDLDRIYSRASGQIEGFVDVPVTISGESADNPVYVRLHRNGGWTNRMILDKSGIQFRSVNSFEVKDIASGATIFTTHRPHYNMPAGANSLVTKTVSASRIQSPIGQPLSFSADGKVSVRGSEGIIVDGASALLQAEHNINVNSTHGATILEASAGIFLNMDKVPIVSSEFGLRTGNFQYKICVCMPQGTLFRIPIPRLHNAPKVSCAHFTSTHDPCAVN